MYTVVPPWAQPRRHDMIQKKRLIEIYTLWTVPETVDKEKKSPVVDKDSLRGLAPDFNRGEAVFERNTLKIVEINVF